MLLLLLLLPRLVFPSPFYDYFSNNTLQHYSTTSLNNLINLIKYVHRAPLWMRIISNSYRPYRFKKLIYLINYANKSVLLEEFRR
jgi:hypothetical protein